MKYTIGQYVLLKDGDSNRCKARIVSIDVKPRGIRVNYWPLIRDAMDEITARSSSSQQAGLNKDVDPSDLVKCWEAHKREARTNQECWGR
jgi:hypothetical protein